MSIPIWPYGLSSYYSPATPSNYYYMQSPCVMLNSSIGNFSSGYESASNENSLIDPGYSSPISAVKAFSTDLNPQRLNIINKIEFEDEETDESMSNTENYSGRKKRRVLSRPQRQEANRRERQRMEIINEAYEQLRDALPFKKGRKRQKMSRMDTVDGAIQYIHSLLKTLHGPGYNPDWVNV